MKTLTVTTTITAFLYIMQHFTPVNFFIGHLIRYVILLVTNGLYN